MDALDKARKAFDERLSESFDKALKELQKLGYPGISDPKLRIATKLSRPENKVSLGFVEGLNNKIRGFQRRAYGLRDDEYSASRSSLACFPRYDRVGSPTRIPEEPTLE
jgi:transposase